MTLRRFSLSSVPAALAVVAGCAGLQSAPRGTDENYGGRMQAVADVAVDAVREQTADQQIVHVLNRLGFGPRPGDILAVRALGVDAWIERQLDPVRIDDRAAARFADSSYGRIA